MGSILHTKEFIPPNPTHPANTLDKHTIEFQGKIHGVLNDINRSLEQNFSYTAPLQNTKENGTSFHQIRAREEKLNAIKNGLKDIAAKEIKDMYPSLPQTAVDPQTLQLHAKFYANLIGYYQSLPKEEIDIHASLQPWREDFLRTFNAKDFPKGAKEKIHTYVKLLGGFLENLQKGIHSTYLETTSERTGIFERAFKK